MKRKALLIGNTNGLEGVQVDITKLRRFLKSPTGGAWEDSEILVAENPDLSDFLLRLGLLRSQSLDFAFVLFSGHGAHIRETVLELNPKHELLPETKLHNLAPRQITVVDCCRGVIPDVLAKATPTMEALDAAYVDRVAVRKRYEARIMSAMKQQARLYACAVDEAATDDAKMGAVYFGHLLDSAQSFEMGLNFKTVEAAHAQAKAKTLRDSRTSNQTPEALLPKCLPDQQLILSIRP